MSAGRDRPPTPLEVIADALDEPAGRATFMRGLMLGALVGAAVVGSVLRARQARRRRPRPVMVVSGTAVEPGDLAEQGSLAEPGNLAEQGSLAEPSAGSPDVAARADGMGTPGTEPPGADTGA